MGLRSCGQLTISSPAACRLLPHREQGEAKVPRYSRTLFRRVKNKIVRSGSGSSSELRSCVKVEVAVQDSPSLIRLRFLWT